MAEADNAVVVERRIAAPAPLVWALVADTNRFDRASGLVPGKYGFEEVADASGRKSRELVASARQTGFDLRWVEPPYDWVEGVFVRGERRFLQGPLRTGGFEVQLRPDGEGATLVRARAWVTGGGFLGSLAKTIARSKFRGALSGYLEGIERVLAAKSIDFQPDEEPPAAAARRALMASEASEVTSGKQSRTDEDSFAHRAKRFAQSDVAEAVRTRIVEHLHDRPDEELASIRPFELARAWKLDRRAVLRGFLHAARAGLVELHWQIQCPTCRVGASTADSLAFVKQKAHCDTCEITYDCDFGEHVEATFTIHSSIRRVETGSSRCSPARCARSPVGSPPARCSSARCAAGCAASSKCRRKRRGASRRGCATPGRSSSNSTAPRPRRGRTSCSATRPMRRWWCCSSAAAGTPRSFLGASSRASPISSICSPPRPPRLASSCASPRSRCSSPI
jgi:hypothetical protein